MLWPFLEVHSLRSDDLPELRTLHFQNNRVPALEGLMRSHRLEELLVNDQRIEQPLRLHLPTLRAVAPCASHPRLFDFCMLGMCLNVRCRCEAFECPLFLHAQSKFFATTCTYSTAPLPPNVV